MPQPQVIRPGISASDRLGFTLFLALTLHAMVVLGVGFKQQERSNQDSLPNLEIILANSRSFEEVDNPDFLAQVNQLGGGKLDHKSRPSAPVSANTPFDQKGLADQDRAELQQQQLAINDIYFLTQSESTNLINQLKQLHQQDSRSRQASEVDQRQSKIARLQAEIRQMTIDYARRPRILTLTASTRKAVEAGYLATWVQKIETTGNLNYPQEARLKKLDGRLRMSVRLNSSGEIIDVKITSSSGTSVLDEAARRILRMAEPFAPFPEELRERADQIVIIRTWDFKSNQITTSSGVS